MTLPLIRRAFFAIVSAAALVSCSSGGGKAKPAELPVVTPRLHATQAWKLPVGATTSALMPAVVGDLVAVASASGQLLMVRVGDGSVQSRVDVGAKLQAGVGFDGHMAAVVTERNELVAAVGNQVVWRNKLAASAYTTPLVAGQRVFVMTSDRTVQAFDGNTGIRLWQQTRTGEALVLRQPGVLTAFGDTLLAGIGGRLVAFNPSSGSIRWEVAAANPRGGNDVERLVDLVHPVSRIGSQVCARAFQAAVACLDASRGVLSWRQNSDGQTGVSGDESLLFGTDAAGRIQAWKRANGEVAWTQDALKFRGLTAPLWLGQSVVVGDAQGLLHFVSRDDGSVMARIPTDGSPLVGAPVLAGDTLIAQTRSGNLFAWRPQ